MDIRISGIVEESIVDGPGIRYVVFTQGCVHNCKGCHNPETHSLDGGKLMDTDEIFKDFKIDPLLKGITFSGGEPFLQPEPLIGLGKKVHEFGKEVLCYSGYTFEYLIQSGDEKKLALLKECDILIDGKFIEEEKNLELHFRGSENQRIIDVKKSLLEQKTVEIEYIDN